MLSGACRNSAANTLIYPRTCCIVAVCASLTTRPNASARTSRFCKVTRPVTMIQPRRFLALRRSALLMRRLSRQVDASARVGSEAASDV